MSTASPAEPVTTLESANGTTGSTFKLPKAKLSALERFKSFTNSSAKSGSEDSGSSTTPTFPPSSWSLPQTPIAGSGASSWSNDVEKWKSEIERWKEQIKSGLPGMKSQSLPIETPPAAEQPAGESTSSAKGKEKEVAEGNDDRDISAHDQTADDDPKEAPEPRTMAEKIRALIDESLKSSSANKNPQRKQSHSAPNTPGPSNTSPGDIRTPTGSSTLDPSHKPGEGGSMFRFGIDSKLAKMLSSETIMNGGFEKGRESVWAILDKMGYNTSKDKEKGKEKERERDHNLPEDDGIMMYTPLQPTTELEPEIAESVLSYASDSDSDAETVTGDPPSAGAPPETTVPSSQAKASTQPKRVFQPSPTKLSLQCTWWGYRLYIPPPIMAQLSNAHIAAAKRGAMITAALKWLLDKVPIMMIPLQLRPGVMMLRQFSPYLGYIGAFVAWSWQAVENKDKGNGVVLTATWLLPVAIVPSSWDFEAHGRPLHSANDNPAVNEAPANPTADVASTNQESAPPAKPAAQSGPEQSAPAEGAPAPPDPSHNTSNKTNTVKAWASKVASSTPRSSTMKTSSAGPAPPDEAESKKRSKSKSKSTPLDGELAPQSPRIEKRKAPASSNSSRSSSQVRARTTGIEASVPSLSSTRRKTEPAPSSFRPVRSKTTDSVSSTSSSRRPSSIKTSHSVNSVPSSEPRSRASELSHIFTRNIPLSSDDAAKGLKKERKH